MAVFITVCFGVHPVYMFVRLFRYILLRLVLLFDVSVSDFIPVKSFVEKHFRQMHIRAYLDKWCCGFAV